MKNNKQKKKSQQKIRQLAQKNANQMKSKGKKKKAGPMMGPVASITTAPVAIGNSVKGSQTQIVNTVNGCLVRGRDFMFTPIGTGSITTWTMVGGTPLAPVAFGDSSIRQYMQMYQRYRWRRCVVYYITSSPTSSTGDVMFYYGKNRDSVYLNQTSSFLLPFVLSDSSTVIGPQWTNHVADINVTGTWKSTDYGMEAALNSYADGEVFLLSKTTTTDSPGYVLFDYEVEFADLQITPRLLGLPLPRAQYSNIALQLGGAKTQGNPATFNTQVGVTLNGTTSSLPSGWVIGDIYKVIVDNTNSTYTVGTAANLLQLPTAAGSTQPLTLTDGTTLYGVIDQTNDIVLFANPDAAYAAASPLQFGASLTYNVTIQIWISLVGSISNLNLKPNF